MLLENPGGRHFQAVSEISCEASWPLATTDSPERVFNRNTRYSWPHVYMLAQRTRNGETTLLVRTVDVHVVHDALLGRRVLHYLVFGKPDGDLALGLRDGI